MSDNKGNRVDVFALLEMFLQRMGEDEPTEENVSNAFKSVKGKVFQNASEEIIADAIDECIREEQSKLNLGGYNEQAMVYCGNA